MENERGEMVSHSMQGEVQGNVVPLLLPKAAHSTVQLSTGLTDRVS